MIARRIRLALAHTRDALHGARHADANWPIGALGPAMTFSSSNPSLTSAVEWLESLLLGSLGTTVAVLAIAAIGLLMLRGRLPARRGATVILGCFILFSAASIAQGIVSGLSRSEPTVAVADLGPVYTPATPKPLNNDPYAGASVPDQRTKDIFH